MPTTITNDNRAERAGLVREVPEEERTAPRSPSDADRGAVLLVWGTWALMLLAALAFVGKYGSNVPHSDDWFLVPVLSGEQPVTAGWVWAPHAEHRIPLARLTQVALYRLTGCDFRAGMFFQVCVLGILSAVMIRAARALRGWTAYTDVFFPLVWLNWGNCRSLLWSWQVAFLILVALVSVVLLVMVRRGSRPGAKAALLAGLCLVLLPLCGPTGLVFVPPFTVWLAWVGAGLRRSPEPGDRRTGLVVWALLLALAVGWGRAGHGEWSGLAKHYVILLMPALCGLYFIGQTSETVAGRWLRAGVFFLVCAHFAYNMHRGQEYGRSLRERNELFEQDLRAGLPASLLADRHASFLCSPLLGPRRNQHDHCKETIAGHLLALRRARIGPFSALQEDPAWQDEELVIDRTGNDPSLTFDLPRSRRVYALRLTFHPGASEVGSREDVGNARPFFRVCWRKTGQEGSAAAEASVRVQLPEGSGETVATVWVDDTIDHLRVLPDDNRCVFRVTKAVLLVPPSEPADAPSP